MRRSYDAFGSPRTVNLGNATGQLDPTLPTLQLNPTSRRGFTDHEHLDRVRLIHMNGRVYDYRSGRFLSVDPFVKGGDSQSLNPYSYILNNPLSGTDPSGYEACGDQIKDGETCEVTTTKTVMLPGSRTWTTIETTYTVGSNGAELFITPGAGKEAVGRINDTIDKINQISSRPAVQALACMGQCHGTDGDTLNIGMAARNPKDAKVTDLALSLMPVTGFMTSGYEFATGQTLMEGESASRTMAAFGLVTFGLAKWLKPVDEFVDLYHGTSRSVANAIREDGILLSKSRASLDFGAGFYTTTNLAQAERWAARMFKESGEVLHFRVPISELSKFRARNFSSADSAWESFVRWNRGMKGRHEFDIVNGPMLGNPIPFARGARAEAWGQQTSFHTQSVIDLLNGSLVKGQ